MTTCPEACFPPLGESMWGMSTSSKPRSKRLCLELSGRKKKAPKHSVMKALRMRRRMNFSESLSVALWCGNAEAPGDKVGIRRPDRGRSAGVVMFGSGSGGARLWGGARRAGRGKGRGTEVHKRHMCRSSGKFKWIYYLISASKCLETKTGPSSSAEERRGGSRAFVILLEGKDKTRSLHSFVTSPVQHSPKIPSLRNVCIVFCREISHISPPPPKKAPSSSNHACRALKIEIRQNKNK